MVKKSKKILGGLILVCALFLNMVNVAAASNYTISASNKPSQDLPLGGTSDQPDFTYGTATYAITSVSNNVVVVRLSINNSGDQAAELSGVNTLITLTDDVFNNFDVTIGESSAHGTPEYTEGQKTITWTILDTLAVGDTAYMTYTLVPRSEVSDDIMGSTLRPSDNATIMFSGTTVDFEPVCTPTFVISDGTTPPTGIFTNMLLLTGIVGASIGILVLSLKNNKFQNI